MPSFRVHKNAFLNFQEAESEYRTMKRSAFDAFNPKVLGLGDIQKASVSSTAICALFDLEGFTTFCKQIEPHLSVPIFLSEFLDWIFEAIRNETIKKRKDTGDVIVWHDLPFFVKFMGDGLMVLWDTANSDAEEQHNLIVSCHEILKKYRDQFVSKMRRKVVDVPPMLRCGIAKGTVFSVGNGEDYVGSCINVAARLQSFHGLTMAFARRGFDPENGLGSNTLKNWMLKKVSIRGIGDSELVYILKQEFDALPEPEKKLFANP
jgi:class 3 adenylate cyclase